MARFSRERSMLGPEDDTASAWGVPRTFEEWVLTYQAEIFSLVYGVIGDRNQADSIAVEAFAQVHALVNQGRVEDTPVAELYRIAIRESARRLAKRPRTNRDGGRQSGWRNRMRPAEKTRKLLWVREGDGDYGAPQ